MMHTDTRHTAEGFISAQGKQLVDGKGRPVLLRGVGLGSWFLPEGYMWKMPAEADRPRRMEKLILELVGPQSAAEFWEAYWDNFISEEDVRQIAAEGFNSLRLPINARYLTGRDDSSAILESRIARIDSLLRWCRAHQVYVILDLHGAPGGQTGTNIDDSEFDRPDLFRIRENQDRTVEIWRTLAERYKDEYIIAGYDLLNEPLPEWFSEYNGKVLPLYRRITEAIRSVDSRHLIILEGVHWATDWSIFQEPFDENVMLQFHKYWNNPDKESIAAYLDARDKWNLPIFMGEGGENNPDWYSGAFRMFEDLDISWNFWTWKKLATHNSPVSISLPAGWDRLVRAVASESPGSAAPTDRTDQADRGLDAESARSILNDFAESVKFGNCEYRPEVVRALLRRPPVRIPAIFYSYRDKGCGFDPGPAALKAPQSPSIDFRRVDGMRFGYVDSSAHQTAPNFAHNGGEAWKAEEWMYLQLEAGGWAEFDFLAAHTNGLQAYTVTLRMRSVPGACVRVSTAGQNRSIVIPPAAGPEADDSFHDYALTAKLPPGLQPIRVLSENEAVQLQWLHVTIPD